jgi:hypothetical protein
MIFLVVVLGAGLLCGFLLGRRTGRLEKQDGIIDPEVALAQKNYADSLVKMKEAMEPYQGNTAEEKYDSFLKSLDTTSFAHLGPEAEEKFKFLRQYLKDNKPL